MQTYAKEIARWKSCDQLLAASTEDYMCEPLILEKTGLTIPEHQRLTLKRYDELLLYKTGVYILPVLQGYVVSPINWSDRHVRILPGGPYENYPVHRRADHQDP